MGSDATPHRYALALFGGVSRMTGSTVLQAAGSRQFDGEPINISVLAHSYRWAWLDRFTFDVFIHSWSVELAAEFRQLYSPLAATFETNAARLSDIRDRLHPSYHDCVRGYHGVNREFCMFNTASMAFSIREVLRLVSAHEDVSHQRYDRVVLSRPDLVFTEQPPRSVLSHSAVVIEAVGIPAIRGFADTVFVLPSSAAARRMSGIFDFLRRSRISYRWGCIYRPHSRRGTAPIPHTHATHIHMCTWMHPHSTLESNHCKCSKQHSSHSQVTPVCTDFTHACVDTHVTHHDAPHHATISPCNHTMLPHILRCAAFTYDSRQPSA
jgi:hypothetical protein